MLSVLIETMNDGEGLARTLSSLVGAAVEGVVREVVVCDRGSTDATAAVADHAGCTFIANADIAAGIRRAKGDWLLLLEPGARLEGDWMAAVLDHAATATMPACFSRSRSCRGSSAGRGRSPTVWSSRSGRRLRWRARAATRPRWRAGWRCGGCGRRSRRRRGRRDQSMSPESGNRFRDNDMLRNKNLKRVARFRPARRRASGARRAAA